MCRASTDDVCYGTAVRILPRIAEQRRRFSSSLRSPARMRSEMLLKSVALAARDLSLARAAPIIGDWSLAGSAAGGCDRRNQCAPRCLVVCGVFCRARVVAGSGHVRCAQVQSALREKHEYEGVSRRSD